MTPWLLAFFCLATAGCSNITDQHTSESQHDKQVAILKQIRKLNEDGSYTYGYEADDGSFKVESRDVLGNIKGTFGFVDATGEIKRVSYSSLNGTGFKSTTVSPLQEQISIVQSIPRNRTSTTRKPNLYTTSTESDSRTTVVQPIPRTRKSSIIPTVTTTTATTTENPTRPSFSRSKGRHSFVINGQQRSLVLEEDEILDEDSQIIRPSASVKDTSKRRVIFAKRPLDQNLRPITEEFEDKEEKIKITTGNSLRRQLHDESTKAAPVIEQEEDHADIYGGALSTSRPLFTTATPPRVVQRINTIKHDRQKHLYVNQDNNSIKPHQDQRIYEEQESKHHNQEDRNTAQQILIRATTRAPPDPREYIRQSTEPLYFRQQPDGYIRNIQPGGILIPVPTNHLDEDPAYRQIPINKLLFRSEFNKLLPVNQQSLYPGTTDANVHYITDSPPAAQEQEETAPRIQINPSYLIQQRPAYQRQLTYSDGLMDPRRGLLRPFPQPIPQDEREYQNIGSEYGYRMGQLALPPEPPNPIATPLSRRDFQILLRRLLISQYGIQALNYPKTYLEDALYDQQPYPSYQPVYQTPVPRTEVPYPSEPVASTVPVAPVVPIPPSSPAYPERISSRRSHMYSRAVNPLYQHNQYDDYTEPKFQKRAYRHKFYTQEVPNEGEEILPPQIREALLLRMLQLAINAERPVGMANTIASTSVQSPTRYRKSGPVRNVQILGEDIEENKMRKNI